MQELVFLIMTNGDIEAAMKTVLDDRVPTVRSQDLCHCQLKRGPA